MAAAIDYSKLSTEELVALAQGKRAVAPTAFETQARTPQAPDVPERIGRGMMDVYHGVKQKYLNWTDPNPNTLPQQIAPSSPAKDYTAEVNKERAYYEQGREAAGDTGIDWMRGLGSIATPAALVPGGGVGLIGRAAAGVAGGGLLGYGMFNPENTQGSNLLNTGVGAVTGGVVNAAAPAVIDTVLKGGQALKNKGMEWVRGAAQSVTPNLQTNITNNIKVSLTSQGVDWDNLVPNVQAGILADAKEQLARTGKLDAAQLLRKADIEAVAGPNMAMSGQVTRDPVQWTSERNLQKVEANIPAVQRGEVGTITQRLVGQDEGMERTGNAVLDRLYGGTPAASRAASPFQASERAVEAVKGAHATLGDEVSAIYTAARQHLGAGARVPVTGPIKQRITDAITDFEDVMPGPILTRLREFGLDGRWQEAATRQLTVDDADKLLKLVNKRYASADPAGQAALNEVRGALKDSVLELGKSGNAGAKKFMDAWSAARGRFEAFEPKPLANIVNDRVNTANFLETQVLKGNPNDLVAIRDMISKNEGPSAWNDLRGQAWQWVLDKATQQGRGSFSGAKFDAALNQIGPDRMKVLFADEMPKIEQLRRGALAMTNAPAHSAVNHPNTASALLGGALRLGNRIPILNMATAPIATEVQNATSQNLIAQALSGTSTGTSARDAAQTAFRNTAVERLLSGSAYPGLLGPGMLEQQRKSGR